MSAENPMSEDIAKMIDEEMKKGDTEHKPETGSQPIEVTAESAEMEEERAEAAAFAAEQMKKVAELKAEAKIAETRRMIAEMVDEELSAEKPDSNDNEKVA